MISFGKRPKHKKFGYIPRFYDEEKDKLQERINQHKGTLSDEDKVKQRISSGLRNRYAGDEAYRKTTIKKSNMRILYILIILMFISYIILTSNRIQLFLETFG